MFFNCNLYFQKLFMSCLIINYDIAELQLAMHAKCDDALLWCESLDVVM